MAGREKREREARPSRSVVVVPPLSPLFSSDPPPRSRAPSTARPAPPHTTLSPHPPQSHTKTQTMAPATLLAGSAALNPAALVSQLVAFAASIGLAAFLAWFVQ